jgi:RND family efflux transporter MFP subunit
MKKILTVAIISLFIISCKNNNQQAQLEELKAKQQEIAEQITQLEIELSAKEGNVENENKKIVYVNLKEVEPETFQHFVTVQGDIKSDNNIFAPFQSPGVVRKIYVEEGQLVSKGQLLAEVDGSIYMKSMEGVQVALDLATDVYHRQKRLWEKEIGSEIQYLTSKTKKEGLEKQLQTLKEQYKLTKLITPISGTVDEIKVKEGEAAAPGFGAIRIVQNSGLKIKALLSESYITKVKKGDKVKVKVPSLDKEFNTKINAVSQAISSKNRTFSIEIKIPGTIKNIKPNMLAILTINDYMKEKALVVPINTIQKTEDSEFLFVAIEKNNQLIAEKRVVKTGLYYGDKVEIIEGLSNKDKVIIFGFQNLTHGMEIAISE